MTTASPLRSLSVAFGSLLVATAACAQYKIVGPDGKVTYTDRPPTAQARPEPGAAAPGAGPAANGQLPYETRQAMSRFPVNLYAAKTCAPCDQARAWLKARNVPFTEFSVDTDGDVRALQARFNDSTVPVITVGGQSLRGFNQSELESTINAAGYPQQARLFGYRWPAATPLAPPVARVEAPRPSAPAPAPKPQQPEQPKGGIQF